jgi:hypothetical protein
MKRLIGGALRPSLSAWWHQVRARHTPTNCPVTQLCGPVSQEYAGDQNGARYGKVLDAYGVKAQKRSTKLGQTICGADAKASAEISSSRTSSLIWESDTTWRSIRSEWPSTTCPDYFDMS